jgi:hypothetical protein
MTQVINYDDATPNPARFYRVTTMTGGGAVNLQPAKLDR